MVGDMQGRGVIQKSDSTWLRQHLVVTRCARPEGWRPSGLCWVPEVEWHHRGLLPAPVDRWTLDTLIGVKWFSTFDLKNGYWQVLLQPDDKEYMVIFLGDGLWQFTVMPFSLGNAPATFKQLVNWVLWFLPSIPGHNCYHPHISRKIQQPAKYIPEGMRSPTESEHREVLTILQEARYLEHIVLPEVVTTDPKKLEAIKSWPLTNTSWGAFWDCAHTSGGSSPSSLI